MEPRLVGDVLAHILRSRSEQLYGVECAPAGFGRASRVSDLALEGERDWEGFRGKPKHWRDTQIEGLIALLNAAPRTDFVIADAWRDCYRIKTETLYERRAMVNDSAEAGDLLFVLGDLFLDYPGQREKVAEQLGVEHLVCGPQLPFRVFDSHYVARYLPVSEEDRDRIRAGTVRDILE